MSTSQTHPTPSSAATPAVVDVGTQINCSKCAAHLGNVKATARLILTVHCAFCGEDFGLAVDGPAPVEAAPATDASSSSSGA